MEALIRNWLEGRSGGTPGRVLRLPLLPPALLYGGFMHLRRRAYRAGLLRSVAAGAPVLSVGNLTVGGTGKTPLVLRILRILREMNRRPAVLLRGYRSGRSGLSDEALLYGRRADGAAVHVGADRLESARRATGAGADVLVLDDGFQHRRLRRDADIVLLDATAPFGGGWPLPAGLLREFPHALAQADCIVLSRTDQASPDALRALRNRIGRMAPGVPFCESRHAPARLATLAGETRPLESLRGRRLVAACGIGRPDAFARTLRDAGAEVRAVFPFPDHHAWTRDDLRTLRFAAETHAADCIVTEKDAVKLASRPDDCPEGTLVLGVEMVLADEEPLRRVIHDAIARFDLP